MFCPQCGREVSSNNAFCGNCGYKVSGSNDQPVLQGSSVPDGNPINWDAYFLNRWRGFLSSPMILILLVCVTLLQVINISSMGSVNDTMSYLKSFARYYGDEVEIVIKVIDLLVKGIVIYGIATIVSMWLIFLDGKKGSPRLSTTGISIIQFLQAIALILVCVAFGFIVVGCMEMAEEMKEYSYYYSPYYDSIKSEVTKLMIWGVGIGIFSIVVCANILRLVGSVKTTMRTFVPTYKSAMFVGVYNILMGAVSIYFLMKYDSIDMNMTTILSLACTFLYAIVTISYRSVMKALEEERIRVTR